MEFKLPELGEGVHEGELVTWRVKKGENVTEDQVLCEIMTDKATIEIPSPFKGVVKDVHAKEGSTVKVGQTLISFEGKIVDPGATPHLAGDAAPAPAKKAEAAPVVREAPLSAPASLHENFAVESRVLAAPVVRKMAREQDIPLSQVQASGPHGRVMKEDLEKFASGGGRVSRASSGPRETRVAFKGLRKKISEKMRQSKDHAAHFTYVEECDASELVKLRLAAKEMGQAQGVKVTFLPILMKAMVMALKRYPILNSELDEAAGEIIFKNYYNIALSVQTDDGLSAPVVKDIDQKSIFQIAKDIEEVVGRARTKKLTKDDLTGGTITLTNAGTIGGLFATPIINYPEVAIVGFNKIFRKPVVKVIGGAEKIVIRDWTYFSISLDHRIVDGAIGAEFMKFFISILENPALLALGE